MRGLKNVAWVAGLLMLAGGVRAETLTPPAGVKVLESAGSLKELKEKVKPDLFWENEEGAFFLWVKQDEWKGLRFVMDCAYQLKMDGKVVWGFLDEKSDKGIRNGEDRASDFMAMKFVREEISCPTEESDKNQSFAEALSERADGATAYRVQFMSIGGFRAHQCDMEGKLIYRDAKGGWQIAGDFLVDRGFPHGSVSSGTGATVEIVWNEGEKPSPFKVKLVQYDSYLIGADVEGHEEYCTHRDGVMEGEFPMKIKMDTKVYVASGGRTTLKSLAADIHGHEPDEDPAKDPNPKNREALKSQVEKLVKLNPEIDAEKTVEKGKRILIEVRDK